MTFTNHVLTGAALAKFLPLPIAIPAGIASHFILDALPHFGFKTIDEQMRRLRLYWTVIGVDVVVGMSVVAWLISNEQYLWLLNGLIAFSPDVVWIYRFTIKEKFGTIKPTDGNRFIQFHENIQRYERVWGGFIEIPYALIMLNLLR